MSRVAGALARDEDRGGDRGNRFQSVDRRPVRHRRTETWVAACRISRINAGGGMRVAVIGTGIAGNAAAWTLSKRYPVTVYEREIRPGGHSHTVTIDYDGTRLPSISASSSTTNLTIPTYRAIRPSRRRDRRKLHELRRHRRRRPLRMEGRRQQLVETAKGLFAQPRNLLSPSYLVDAARHSDLQHAKASRITPPAAGRIDASVNISRSVNSHRGC